MSVFRLSKNVSKLQLVTKRAMSYGHQLIRGDGPSPEVILATQMGGLQIERPRSPFSAQLPASS